MNVVYVQQIQQNRVKLMFCCLLSGGGGDGAYKDVCTKRFFAPKLAKPGPVGAPHDNKIEGLIAKM